MNSLSSTNLTTEGMWWIKDAWSERMDDVIRLGIEETSNHEGDVDSLLSETFNFSRVNRFKQRGFTQGVAPTSEYLTRLYEKYGTPDEVNGRGPLLDAVIDTPSGMSAFETWKWCFERSGGNREPNRPRPAEPEYAGYTFASRALSLAQCGKFTPEEVERIAVEYANSHVGETLTTPEAGVEACREAIAESLGTKHSFVQREWDALLSNPVLPTLPAPQGSTQTLWDFITSTILTLVEENPGDRVFEARLVWIAQNENASAPLLSRASSLLERDPASFGALIPLQQHPAVEKTEQEFEELLRFVPNLELGSLDDEDFAAQVRKILKGNNADSFYRVGLELMYDPRREQFARELIRELLKGDDWNTLHMLIPLIPAVLNGVEEKITGSIGQLPIDWLLELL